MAEEQVLPEAEEQQAPAGITLTVPEDVELGNLIPEIHLLLGPEKQPEIVWREEKPKLSKRERLWRKAWHMISTAVLRLLLLVLTGAVMALVGLALALNLVFNGPSPSASAQLTQTLLESETTQWIPAVFLGEDAVEAFRADMTTQPNP